MSNLNLSQYLTLTSQKTKTNIQPFCNIFAPLGLEVFYFMKVRVVIRHKWNPKDKGGFRKDEKKVN